MGTIEPAVGIPIKQNTLPVAFHMLQVTSAYESPAASAAARSVHKPAGNQAEDLRYVT